MESDDCSVKVAVHIRPLIGDERLQGCKDCVTVVSGKPQVQIGSHSFTFDHVYGSTGSPSTEMYQECAAPLVDGLFQGYNATVLAYGQTGSGKTYTMGTGCGDNSSQTGIVPQVMNALFTKIETLKDHIEFQIHVSFIEIHKEEVQDLLDPSTSNKSDTKVAHVPGKPPIQIRESSNGVITLAGSTEVSVTTLKEMAACLDQGSVSRATGSTNMNNQSSRSHAIFTISVEQMRKINNNTDSSENGSLKEEYLCAKLHLVDLAGSERAKRTGSDGMRFKEGVHINKGLLALGNVISALGDEKKRKDGAHVPYRDSKLTRLLQDSLGGNSRTVMIACISPADINAEETLNTLKYANRARNIRNKPVVNRDPVSSEMLKMRQQLEYLQAELSLRNGGSSCAELQVLKERIASLETANEDLCRELHEYRSRCGGVEEPTDKDFKDIQADEIVGSVRPDGLKRSLHSIESSNYPMVEATTGDSREVDEEAKEWEHKLLQNSMDKELHELNRRLEEKESEMKLFDDPAALKQHFGKKIAEVEDEKRSVQEERNRLLAEIENLASSDGQAQKLQDVHAQNLKSLEAQIQDLKKKQESQVQLLKQKQKSDDAAKRLQDEIQSIKAQKVQLQHRMKQEAEQFRQWKASREKELLQLRKEGRKSEYERHKLQALNQRQKMVLQRKTEEAAMATKRLKELLEARKSSPREHSGGTNGFATNGQTNEKSLQRWLDHELEVMVNVHEVRHEYEKQSHVRAALAEELAVLRQVDEFAVKGLSPPRGKNGFARASSLSPNARTARISSLENMLEISSNSLVAMASQLSEAEERERAFTSRGRWNQLRSMGEAKNLLQYMFNSLAETRCQLWEKDVEIKEMKDQFKEIVGLLRQSELRRKEAEKEVKLREQAHATSLASSPLGTPPSSVKHLAEDMTTPSPMTVPAQKQLKFTPGIANGKVKDSAAFINTNKKMVPMGQVSMRKLSAIGQQSGKLWRWKRSHHQWIVQFKWKWQKPWRLSEWIRHSDETLLKAKSRHKALPKKIM
ncbi:PREDICTED: kinesin-like protein FRA1 isoform X2 [Brassica oleracea var. oleracea]|uniref:Kinesin motor domain-containing protein n=1 Tax=Brassica oleracea var. oleracea TaxID=109376 RepID=A0A0D3DBN3_BRAOL|nr:PREDICTED: kinesin-like protein FRA1 isoform X2 [Brassica oleracea var. oleracea]